ncbi:MAG: ATP-binding cassette domain-containing protein [Roseburia sp.]|nr:ATP-binding cassette domain-containing protein [Roseburia sp.]
MNSLQSRISKTWIRRPATRKCARTPVMMQLEELECGAVCLDMVMAYYRKWVPLEQVRIDCGVSRDGSHAENILLAAKGYGMEASEQEIFPCIACRRDGHFVVLNGFKRGMALLNDPARGEIKIPEREFAQSFTGPRIRLKPGAGFEPGGQKTGVMEFIGKRFHGAWKALLFMIVMAVATSLTSLVSPVFSRIFMDDLLTGNRPEMATPFLAALAAFYLAEIVLDAVRSFYSLRAEGKLAVAANTEYVWHVLRMPVDFFFQRQTGDIIGRKQSNETVIAAFIKTLAPVLINIAMMAVYLTVILRYSVPLSLIGISGMLIRTGMRRYISGKRTNAGRVLMRDSGKLSSATIAGIGMIETIKASGAENGFFQKWAGYQASVNSQNVKRFRITQYYELIPWVVSTLVDSIILAAGIAAIIHGNMTVGFFMAFQSYLSLFIAPITKINNSLDTLQEMAADIERIEDVMEYPADVTGEAEELKDGVSCEKLSGRIELKDVCFGYSRLAKPLIENFNLTIEPGQKIALVGSTGCGKSTMAKLICGLYRPWSGEILFDQKPMEQISRSVFTGSLTVVDQEITLFEDTISANIRMWDSSIEDFEVILAARDASLHEDIMLREGGYQYRMMEGGRDFSGGQRQRLEIARVLAQDPTIVIMDEATSALDAKTEYEIVEAIRQRGITCIVIAHRLSTIRDCDEILFMEQGKIVERGRHEELMALHGAYEKMIMSE